MEEWDQVDFRRGRGRPKMTWLEGVRKDMKHLGLQENEALDRRGWRRKNPWMTPWIDQFGSCKPTLYGIKALIDCLKGKSD